MSSHDLTVMFVSLGVMLALAKVLGEVTRRLGQPAVLGEITAGILLGPTILGRLAPGLQGWLFPRGTGASTFLEGFSTLAVALFLLVCGMEVDLQRVRRQGRTAVAVSLSGIIIPFALGFSSAYLFPRVLGMEGDAPHHIFALFFATALSISSLPVIARTLIDLNLFRTDIGMIVIAAAIFQDLLGWIIFAVILGMIGAGQGHGGGSIGTTIALTLGFTGFMLTVGRALVHRAVPWIQAHASWPGGVMGFALCLALFGAAFTEWAGVHAIFGTFMAGVALGDTTHLRERTRATIEQFVSTAFAPLFFASVGLKVDFVARFDPVVVAVVLVIACAGKILGCGLGARWAGMPPGESWAIGVGMNARGAMEIVLGLLALQAGVIRERLFVALVIMALVTSMMSGPLIQRALARGKRLSFRSFLQPRGFVPTLHAETSDDAISELAAAASAMTQLPAEVIADAVRGRERLLPSGLGHGVAVPSARFASLQQPVVALGVSRRGIDFDAVDGEPARVIVLLLVPADAHDAQWSLLADLSHTFESRETRERVEHAATFTELLAALNWGESHDAPGAGPRRGIVVVGAGPLARALAKRAEKTLGEPACLVDMNRDHCRAAQQEGLKVVQGNALRDVVLFQAQGHQARVLLGLTPNVEVNAQVAAFAKDEFLVPIVAGAGEVGGAGTSAQALDLSAWDDALAGGRAEWSMFEVRGSDAAAELGALPGVTLPAFATRAGELLAFPSPGALRAGDVVHALVRREPTPERRRLGMHVMLDLPEEVTLDALSRQAATALGEAAASVPLSRTVALLAPWLAVVRLTLPAPAPLRVVAARCRAGLVVDGGARPVAVFLLAGSDDQTRAHLETLAAIAQAAERPGFEAEWRAAGGPEDLRRLVGASVESARLPRLPSAG